jgi:predicted amidophosphoribosyltransferase
MAKRLSRYTGIPMISCLERMSGSDTAQKTLGAAQRSENAQGSYVLSRRFQADLRGKSVVIIDDIATTGATLAACASMLKEAGAVQVIALTAAKTVHARAV